jgi:hypothetical protein
MQTLLYGERSVNEYFGSHGGIGWSQLSAQKGDRTSIGGLLGVRATREGVVSVGLSSTLTHSLRTPHTVRRRSARRLIVAQIHRARQARYFSPVSDTYMQKHDFRHNSRYCLLPNYRQYVGENIT